MTAGPGRHAWAVPAAAGGERLDRHVADRLDVARNRVARWIGDGRVRVEGRAEKASRPLRPGERIECDVPEPAPDERVRPEPGELAVLHEDDVLLVIDKPAGLTVHPGAGRPTGTLVHRLLHRDPGLAGVGGPGRPGIVHRLDKDTSGVMVVARTTDAHRALARAFAARRVDKRYLAIVWGTPDEEGRVDAPIGRHRRDRKRMAVIPADRAGARPAVTTWRRIAAADVGGGAISLLSVGLETGRTHQIRVHLKHARHPLVGDPVYGEERWREARPPARAVLAAFPRPALHAWRLAFAHPGTGEPVAFEAPPPADLVALWEEASRGPFPRLQAREA